MIGTADEIIAFGETMALITPDPAVPLTEADRLIIRTAGAESNVACTAAQLGARTSWVSRLGMDALGQRVLHDVASFDVDVSRVTLDSDKPTGVMFKDPAHGSTTVLYYRRDSAASTMTVASMAELLAPSVGAAVVHVSGVTPALSTGCLELVDHVVHKRRLGAAVTTSFDVNYRPRLWSDRSVATTLRGLADASDICFVGLDEAQALWGTRTATEVRQRIGGPNILVVKDGGVGVTVFGTSQVPVFVPALPVQVIEPVGAGDAFAGGFLAASTAGADARVAARAGHIAAGRVMAVVGDTVDQPKLETIQPVLDVSDAEWLDLGSQPVANREWMTN